MLAGGVALVAAMAAVLIAPPPSYAQTVTIGSALPDNPPTVFVIDCGNACTTAIGEIPGRQVTSPCDGTIVRWRLRIAAPGGGTAQAIALRVIRPLGGDQYTGAGSSGSQTLSTVSGEIQQFNANLPVKAGDSIGLDTPEGQAARIVILNSGASLNRFLTGTIPDGEPRTATINDGFELLLNADVECAPPPPPPPPPEPPGLTERTLTLDTNKSKVKKGRKVAFSGQLNAVGETSACEAGQTVELQRKKPKRTGFTVVDQVQTDAQGSFSTKRKVKKTFRYQASAAESPTCGDALSNTEKVKVKKRKKKT